MYLFVALLLFFIHSIDGIFCTKNLLLKLENVSIIKVLIFTKLEAVAMIGTKTFNRAANPSASVQFNSSSKGTQMMNTKQIIRFVVRHRIAVLISFSL